MLVCLCHAVSDRQIDEAIRRGARTAGDVGGLTRAGTDCGSCVGFIEGRLSACAGRTADDRCRASGEPCRGHEERHRPAHLHASPEHRSSAA